MVGPVLVTVEAPRTAKLSAEPSIVADTKEGKEARSMPLLPKRTKNLHFIFLEIFLIGFSFLDDLIRLLLNNGKFLYQKMKFYIVLLLLHELIQID